MQARLAHHEHHGKARGMRMADSGCCARLPTLQGSAKRYNLNPMAYILSSYLLIIVVIVLHLLNSGAALFLSVVVIVVVVVTSVAIATFVLGLLLRFLVTLLSVLSEKPNNNTNQYSNQDLQLPIPDQPAAGLQARIADGLLGRRWLLENQLVQLHATFTCYRHCHQSFCAVAVACCAGAPRLWQTIKLELLYLLWLHVHLQGYSA
mmetsp:Transcript_142062/g.261683  ORF Transcript_142062/g.261683 Transcript_142062/m.261683 type:complete len:206 (+) Transcript_142062:104-721(+)